MSPITANATMPTTAEAKVSHPLVSKVSSIEAIVDEIDRFLGVRTPVQWVNRALVELPTLLIDHANCEYKAAATGMSLLNRYRGVPKLGRLMARLVREEMLHYEQVLVLMDSMGVAYQPLTASRYARKLRDTGRTEEPGRLTDVLLIGAIVEARSCERFAALWPHLPDPLGRYYRSLLRSEGRHYQDYLALARESAAEHEVHDRLKALLAIENALVLSVDQEFRFHSGVPA